MNPVFWALVIIIAAAIWFLMAFIFYPLGRLSLEDRKRCNERT